MLKFSTFINLLESKLNEMSDETSGHGKYIGLSGAKNDERLERYSSLYNQSADKTAFSVRKKAKKIFDKKTGLHTTLGVPAGAPIVVHGHGKDQAGNNVYHITHPITGRKTTIPTTHLAIQTGESGKHNPEYAVMSLWNHFGKRSTDVTRVHGEIEKAAANPSHPLHLANADKSGFKHGIQDNDVAKDTYYQNLKDASHTLSALASHKDFSILHDEGAKMSVIGASRGELTDAYTRHGVKIGSPAATPKSDGLVISGHSGKIKTLSLKQISREQGIGKNGKQKKPKKVGSQIMSSSPEEARAVYGAAVDRMFPAGSKNHKEAHAKLDKIKYHASNTNHLTEGEKHAALANKHIKDLHQTYDKHGLREFVLHEAMTGQDKFKDKQHVATHLVEIGPGAQVYSLGNHPSKNQYIAHHDLSRPEFAVVAGAKNFGQPMATRVRSFEKKKK